MEYRILGKTGIKVSAVGMGCEGFEDKNEMQTAEMVNAAMSNGINFIEIYSSNHVLRSNLGKAFSKYPRESFVVQGHIGSAWLDGQYKRTRNIDECKQAFEDFINLMQLEYVDIGCIHFCDNDEDYNCIFDGDVYKYAVELKKNGKIRAIGISTHNTNIARRCAESGKIDVILFSLNPAYDMIPPSDDVEALFVRSTYDRLYEGVDAQRAELYQLCQNSGISIIVMKAFAGGLLLSDAQSPFGKALSPVQCIHYCLTRPSVASVMVGAHSVKEFEDAAHYADTTDNERDYSIVLAGAPHTSFNGHCMYCGHCAPCSKRIDIAAVNKYLDLSLVQGFVPETVREHYEALQHHAGECIACGKCISNCPFDVDIIEKMKQAQGVFGK